MLFLIIYVLGWVPAFMSMRDIFRNWRLGLFSKLALSLLIFLFSWVGYFAYSYVIKSFLEGEN